jgi:hypothetical protein
MAGSQSKKQRKHGRNVKSPHNMRYKNENRHEKSHIRRIKKHLKRYGANGKDKVATEALTNYEIKAGIFHGKKAA